MVVKKKIVVKKNITKKIKKKKTLDKEKLIKTKGIQILTQRGFIDTHHTEDGIFFQKRKNTKTFYWKPKSNKSGFGRGYEVRYGNVCSYLKNSEWIVI